MMASEDNDGMTKPFKSAPDTSRGEWLRPMQAEPFCSLSSIVPKGFEAYARLFHPVQRDRPRKTKSWKGLDERTYFDGVRDIDAELETEFTTWEQAAESFGTTMHAQAQYARLVRSDYGNSHASIADDGWRYLGTSGGHLEAPSLTAVSKILARHTSTPDAGIAAVWDGWGGLNSLAGLAYLTFEAADGLAAPLADGTTVQPAEPPLHRRVAAFIRERFTRSRLTGGIHPEFAGPDPEPGSGILDRDIAVGPRFEIKPGTGRQYVLFEAGVNIFSDPAWPERAPWIDNIMSAQSPSMIWPDDHAWMLATEIDLDSTLVAGTTDLIRELVQTPNVEALPIRLDVDLTWDGDNLNRPL